MEPVHGRHTEASKFAPEEQDVISNMPDNVITNILDRLPIRDAVRTGILSRDWRFRWNMLTQLVFQPFSVSEKCYTWKDISRLLLHLKELKHLKLHRCHFCPPPSFRGFPNLSSLELEYMRFESVSVGDFINWCPLLEILKFRDYDPVNKMKPVEIARFRNLKTLAFPLCMLDDIAITSFSIFQLFGFLPKLQNLDLDFYSCKLVAEAGARNKLPTAFSSLKTLTLSEINISNGIMLSCGFEIICGCPNLQTLKITADEFTPPPPGITSSEVDYNSMRQFQLRSVVFECFIDTEDEVCLIKCLLARSPLLKKVSIHPSSCLQSDEKLMFARKLLKLHRASPIAEIDFY